MDRLATRFAACKAQGRAALITFVTAGDPDVASTPAILDALVAGGADIIELGMPFTDPMADGPAIELANPVSYTHLRAHETPEHLVGRLLLEKKKKKKKKKTKKKKKKKNNFFF